MAGRDAAMSLRAPRDLLQRATEAAARLGCSRSELVLDALGAHLDRIGTLLEQPVEDDTPPCPSRVPIAHVVNGELIVSRVDCRMRSCPACSRRIAKRIVAIIVDDLTRTGDRLYERVVRDRDLRAWKARVDRRSGRRKQFPLYGDLWHCFTTCSSEGLPVRDVERTLLDAYERGAEAGAADASGNLRRNVNGSRCWALEPGFSTSDTVPEAEEATDA